MKVLYNLASQIIVGFFLIMVWDINTEEIGLLRWVLGWVFGVVFLQATSIIPSVFSDEYK